MRRLEPEERIEVYGEILGDGTFVPANDDPTLLATIGRRCAVTVWGESIEPVAHLKARILWRCGPRLTFFPHEVEEGVWPTGLKRAHVEAGVMGDEAKDSLSYFGAAAVIENALWSLDDAGGAWFEVAHDAAMSAYGRNNGPWRQALLVAADGVSYSMTEFISSSDLARAAKAMGHVAGAPMTARFSL